MPRNPTATTSGLSNSAYATNEQPVDMFMSMYKHYPTLAPLTAMLTRLKAGSTSQSRIDWTESNEIPGSFILTAAAAASGDLTSTQYAYVRNHDLYYYPITGERVLIDAAPTTSTISTVRGWGSSTGAAIPAGATMVRLGPAYPESSEHLNPLHVVNTNQYNFTQEWVKHTKHSTRTMNESTHFGGKGTKRDENNQKMFRDSRKELELGTLFGVRANVSDGTSTELTKTMGGIEEKLRNGTNFFDFAGVITESKLDDWLTNIYAEFPDASNLIALLPPKVYNKVNQMVKPLIRLSPNSKKYGMQLKQYDGAVTLDLIKHPLLRGPGLEEMMFVLDMDYMELVYQSRPTMEFDVSTKLFNYTVDKLYGLISFRIANENRHGMAVGITG